MQKELNPNMQIYVATTAQGLYNIFDQYTDSGYTTPEGLLEMQEYMDEVLDPVRLFVFEAFLKKLQENDIPYDPEMFQQRVVH